MDIKKIRFWDKERNIMLESRQSCVTAFRHFLNVPAAPAFSDCDNQPNPDKYIPMLFSGKLDDQGNELWEGDLVLYKPEFPEIECFSSIIMCVVYDENEACFGISPFYEHEAKLVKWNTDDPMPFFGCPPGMFKKIGNKFENNPELLKTE